VQCLHAIVEGAGALDVPGAGDKDVPGLETYF
jgi:hypothetical protein